MPTGRQEIAYPPAKKIDGICEKRGDVVKAREYWQEALALFKKIGIPAGVQKMETWLRDLERKGRGEFKLYRHLGA